MKTLIYEVGRKVHEVLNSTGILERGAIVGTSPGGDATFRIDEQVETAIIEHLRESGASVALYLEDSGIHRFTARPEYLWVVDPIDGTRPVKSGFEMVTTSIAVSRYREDSRGNVISTFEDVEFGYLRELNTTGRVFFAEKGEGISIECGGRSESTVPWTPRDLSRVSWGFEVCGFPLPVIAERLAELARITSLKGGFYVFNSTAYGLSRLLLGRLDAYVDLRAALLRSHPERRTEFLRYGIGSEGVFTMFPYDMAAAYRILQEAQIPITDAQGRDLGQTRLTDPSEANRPSLLAARDSGLHREFLERIWAQS